jgi:hypothetical protein
VATNGSDPPRRGARFVGRRVAQAVYYALAVFIAGAATVQITQQVFFPEPASEPAPFGSCDAGVRALFDAIEAGRVAADRRNHGEIDTHPDEALNRYRDTVAPIWAHRPAVAELCGGQHRRLLDALERLRYSEEHGVRHQAVELTALRRRVRSLVAESLPAPTNTPAQHDVTP